jgi:hypothetical protein
MRIKPKTDTPQDFERSMKEYFRQKEEFDDKKPHSLTLPPDVRPKEKPVCVVILRWKLLNLVA